MSGEGALSNIRPELAGDVARIVRTLPSVAGRHEAQGWEVWICAGGAIVQLDAARARQLAADIADVCDVIEGRHPAIGWPE